MNIKANRPTTAAAHSTPTKNAAYARTIHEAATLSLRELLNNTSSSISGLDAQQVINNRAHFGTNKVTREKNSRLVNGWQALSSILSLPSCSVWRWYLQ